MTKMSERLRAYLLTIPDRRPPDLIIRRDEGDYLHRWHLIPRNPFLNIYLHLFLKSDETFALHDHPWINMSWVLKGWYIEYLRGGYIRYRNEGDFVFRWPTTAHRVQLNEPLGQAQWCWTLFITGPRVRVWGFHCPKGWMPYTAVTEKIGGIARKIVGSCE